MLEHKATNLDEAIKNLEPVHSLNIQELEQFYVAREHSPIRSIGRLLRVSHQQKFLLTGHRGNGKSTELAKLEAHLQDEFFVVRYPLRDALNLFDLQYIDVLLSMAIQLAKEANADNLPLSKATLAQLENLWSFGKDIDVQHESGATRGGEASAGVGGGLAWLMQLGVRFKSEHSTRDIVRQRVEHRISDLLEGLDTLSRDIENLTEKPILCIVEDLDKTDLSKAKTIFFDNGESISAPKLAIIYTFPVALSRSGDFMHIKGYFSDTYTLPNFRVENKDGEPSISGRAALRTILLNRLERELIENEALELLVTYSGGLPRQLIKLARDACVEVDVPKGSVVRVAHVEAAIARERKEFKRMLSVLSDEQLTQLQTIKASHDIPVKANLELLHTLSVLEYENDELWYDVNPLVNDLLME